MTMISRQYGATGMSRYTMLAIVLLMFALPTTAGEAVINEAKGGNIADGQKSAVDAVQSTRESGRRELRAEQWEYARSGDSILSLPVLRQLVNTWLQQKDKIIEIQYPGGEEGEFWVQELTDWLIALGIPSDHMVIVPGSGVDDVIRFDLIN
jgi:hypothetical protein